MARYLISFNNGSMDIAEEDLPEVSEAAHAVIQEAKDAGVFVFGGGLPLDAEYDVVATDGTITDGPYPESKEFIGGILVVDVPTREAALEWAAKTAVACRCAQDVREFLPDSAVE
ncbi:YciI family protein [Actinopolymorpha pittospori]